MTGHWQAPALTQPAQRGDELDPEQVLDVLDLVGKPTTPPAGYDDAHIWVAPGRLGGKPCIGGHRLSVDQVTRYVWGGGVDVVQIAHPYLTREQVLTACWYQAVYGTRQWRRRWGAWAHEHGDAMWSGRWDDVPEPPNGDETTKENR